MKLVIKKRELVEFYIRWDKKASDYELKSLSDYFDKFFTLYVILNRIYNLIAEILKQKGELKILKQQGKIGRRSLLYENEAATVCVAHYLRNESDGIINSLQRQISVLRNIIDNELFYISRSNDKVLLKKLNSAENVEILESLLTILYKLRCNMFHAKKGFDMEQEIILAPTIEVLFELNKVLMLKIEQEE